jgi:hypothetical protein
VRYMLLIHANEIQEANIPPEAMGKLMAEYYAFSEELLKSGAMRGGERLRPTTSATTVRVRNGDTLTTDGPFAETKEQFGGYYMIDVPDLDEAIRWASKIPGAKYGCVEVRPIWEMQG